MVKILYVHQYFKTPEEGGSIRSYYLAKGLVEAGHEVVVLTSHAKKKEVKNVDGIDVHYLNVDYDNKFGFFRRLFSFWKFVTLAKKEIKFIGKVDLAYVMTTPLTTGFIGIYLKKSMNIPYYFEVGDLWPEAPIQMGVIRNRFLKRWLYALERKFYFEADKVIALSPAIRNYIEQVSPQTKVYVIPNMADCEFFDAGFRLGDISHTNHFYVTYCGAIGKANHLEFLLKAANVCQMQGLPVRFNILGDGAELPRLKKQYRKLENVRFFDHTHKEGVKKILCESDAVYVSFKDVKVLNTGSPNKFFDSLAAGKLTIINFEGWLKNILEKNKCGFYHDPHRPEAFVRKLKAFLQNPDLLQQYQKNGRKLAELYYDKEIQITKLLNILNNEYKFELNDSEVYILTA
ncbi:MAG: glycosyltransferase family 4 protein [Bacteroidota bacterium]